MAHTFEKRRHWKRVHRLDSRSPVAFAVLVIVLIGMLTLFLFGF